MPKGMLWSEVAARQGPSRRIQEGREFMGVLDSAATVGSAMLAEPLSGYWGLLQGAMGNDPAGAVRSAQDAMTWRPRTPEGQRNLGVLGKGLESAMNFGGALNAPSANDMMGFYNDRTVPAAQYLMGDEAGAALGAGGAAMAGVGIPGRAGKAQRISKRLIDGEIDPDQWRKLMAREGLLTGEELSLMPPKRERSVADMLSGIEGMSAPDLAEAALAGWPKKGWYKNSAKAINDIFGEDAPRFAYLLSALSPQTSVESNLKNAVNTWGNWVKAGRPTDKDAILDIMAQSVEGTGTADSVLGAWRNNAYRALSTENMQDIKFSGPKVTSFARNLMGELGEVTNDAWMAKAMDVDQDIFSGAGNVRYGKADEFGGLTTQGAGYTAANAVTREAADILTRRLADQGVTVDPAEIQETVWSYAKAMWERRDGEGNLKSIGELYDEGALADDAILEVPDFGTLLHNNPDYHATLKGAGANIDNVSPPVYDSATTRPTPQRAGINRFNTRLEDNYRRATIPSELNRTVTGILNNTSMPFEDPGRAVSPRWMQGEKGRELPMDEYRQKRFQSLGIPTPRLFNLEPGEGAGNLFHQRMADVTGRDTYGAAVDVYDPEKYAGLDLYMTPDAGAGFALDGANIVSLFKDGRDKGLKGIADFMLPAAIQQGGRYLDAFDTVLPSLYSRSGMKPTSRLAFDDEFAPANWDYETFGDFNNGRPDVMTMVLDPAEAEPFGVMKGPYDKRSKAWKKKRGALLAPDYDSAFQMQMDEYQRILNSGRYPGYGQKGSIDPSMLKWLGLLGGGAYIGSGLLGDDVEESGVADRFRPRLVD